VAGYYLATSALVKRYANEKGTDWIIALTEPPAHHDLFLVRLAGVEMVAAFARHARQGSHAAAAAARAITAFRLDWDHQYQRVAVTVSLLDRAMLMAERHGLRGYDAVHLAAALLVAETYQTIGGRPLTLVAADTELLGAGAAEGLATANPTTQGKVRRRWPRNRSAITAIAWLLMSSARLFPWPQIKR